MKSYLYVAVAVLLAVSPVWAGEVYVDNVVIVLDGSGSMSGAMSGTRIRRLDAAKQSIKEVVKTLPPSTQVGLLVFGGVPDAWVFPLGPRNDTALFSAVDGISAGGGTPLGAYMKKGADRLLEARKAQYGYGSYRLLVVTDGEASDEALVDRYTPDIISRGIGVDVIGVDMQGDHTLATRVHSYRRANDPEALTRAVQEVFAELGKGAGSGVGEEAFAELEGLSAELALAMIEGLLTSGDQPIGQSVASAAGAASAPARQAPTPAGVGKRRGPPVWLILFVVVIVVLRLARRSSRR